MNHESRVGEVWELVYKDPPHEIVVIVESVLGPYGYMHQGVVIYEGRGDYGWNPGRLVHLGEWDDANGWRRIA